MSWLLQLHPLFLFILTLLPIYSLQLKLRCGDYTLKDEIQAPQAKNLKTYRPWKGDICTDSPPSTPSYIICNECDSKCRGAFKKVGSSHLVISPTVPQGSSGLYIKLDTNELEQIHSDANCTLQDDESQADALKSFSKTSVLFVSISFIILMVISLAWLVFYYVQRFRYAHAKDRLQRRLFNAARKALQRIPTRALKSGDIELETDCAVCIDPYQINDVVRSLPCKHVYHKSCIDPWLLEHRTCPMCKSDILKHFGYQVTGTVDVGRVEIERDANDVESPDPPSSNTSDATFHFQQTREHDSFHYSPSASPQLVMSSSSAKTFAIVPITVHSKAQPQTEEVDQPSTSSAVVVAPLTSQRNERASSAGVVEVSTRPATTRAGSQGQIVNIVHVRARAQSCTRAVTVRKQEKVASLAPVDSSEPI